MINSNGSVVILAMKNDDLVTAENVNDLGKGSTIEVSLGQKTQFSYSIMVFNHVQQCAAGNEAYGVYGCVHICI